MRAIGMFMLLALSTGCQLLGGGGGSGGGSGGGGGGGAPAFNKGWVFVRKDSITR